MITKKRSREIFLDLVKIYSPSGKEDAVAKYIVDFFKVLKKRARRDKHGNVTVNIPGDAESLLLCAHMDTVPAENEIKPTVKKGVIKSDGTTILGADDKAGIASILCAIEHLVLSNKPHRSLELVFTVGEEVDHSGAFNLNYKKLRSKEAILIDDCAKLGRVTLASPFLYELEIRVKGKSAHIGALPQRGVNALQIASKAIGEIRLGRINRTTTVNLGLISGGTEVSEIPGEVIIKGEVRSIKQEKALENIDKINRVFKKFVRRYKARLYFRSKLFVKGYEHNKTNKLIKSIDALNKEFGFKTVYQKDHYLTDANVFNSKGIEMVNISFGGHGEHTNKEWIKIDELKNLAEYLVVYSLM